MSIHVNVEGQNKKTSSAWMKINGEWKKGVFWNNVNGEWKKHSNNSGFKYIMTVSDSMGRAYRLILIDPLTNTIISNVPLPSEIVDYSISDNNVAYNPYTNTAVIMIDRLSKILYEISLTGSILRKLTTTFEKASIPIRFLNATTAISSFGKTLASIDLTTGAIIKEFGSLGRYGSYNYLSINSKVGRLIASNNTAASSEDDTGSAGMAVYDLTANRVCSQLLSASSNIVGLNVDVFRDGSTIAVGDYYCYLYDSTGNLIQSRRDILSGQNKDHTATIILPDDTILCIRVGNVPDAPYEKLTVYTRDFKVLREVSYPAPTPHSLTIKILNNEFILVSCNSTSEPSYKIYKIADLSLVNQYTTNFTKATQYTTNNGYLHTNPETF